MALNVIKAANQMSERYVSEDMCFSSSPEMNLAKAVKTISCIRTGPNVLQKYWWCSTPYREQPTNCFTS